MKKRSTLLWYFAAAFAATAIAACGKSGGGGSNNSTPEILPISGPALVLPAGTKIGFFAQNSKMDAMYINQGSSYVLQSGMNNVLKYAMRTCDRGHSTGGLAACPAWLNGFHDIMLFANGSQATTVQMVIRAMPDTSCQSPYYCSQYWYSIPSGKSIIASLLGIPVYDQSSTFLYNPMVLNMQIWPINDSKGFELRGYAPGGDMAYGSGNLLFQFQVANGKLEDPAWEFQLAYNGTIAATGRMVRCSTSNCGVQGF